jgi:hypothetical protein
MDRVPMALHDAPNFSAVYDTFDQQPLTAMPKRKSSIPKVRDIVQYMGRGGACTSKGQTVTVKAKSKREGYLVVDVIHPKGHRRTVTVKGGNLAPLQPQLF